MTAPPKPETDDPMRALKDPSIHVRAAACRDLSSWGQPEHLSTLIQQAHQDASPAVRLGCASAASDILSRHRLPPHAESVTLAQRRAWVDDLRGFDPAVNSGLFPIIACLGLPELLPRIGAGLRDPRGDVRVGAAVGLLRMVSSAAVNGDELMEQRVISLLADRRLPPDALAAVAQICAAVGYRSALPHLSRLQLSGAHHDAVQQALDIFTQSAAGMVGLWLSDGRDAGEVNPISPQGEAFALIDSQGMLSRDASGHWAGHSAVPSPARRMCIRPVGAPSPIPALQLQQRTWHAASPQQLRQHIDETIQHTPPDWTAASPTPTLAALAVRATPFLSDSAADWQRIGQLHACAGNTQDAVNALRQAVAKDGPSASAWLHLGDGLHALNHMDEAQRMWRKCARVPGGGSHARQAKQRLKAQR